MTPAVAIRVLNSCSPGPWHDPPIQQIQLTSPQAAAIFRLWRNLGAPPKTSLWATLLAYRESRFDGLAVNSASGAAGLYQGLSPSFRKVAVASSRLEDALPIMKLMFREYGMSAEVSLHALYAAHFQGMYAKRNVDNLRGFIDAQGSTYDAQYATTNGRMSVSDLGFLTISALCDLPDIAQIQNSYMLTMPTKIDDRRYRYSRPDYMGPVAIYLGDNHLKMGETIDADSFDIEGDFYPFKSDPRISVLYTNPSVYHESSIQIPVF